MVLFNSILIILSVVFFTCLYYYFRERKLLRDFIQTSRRHRQHQSLDFSRRQKANRYLTLSMLFLSIIIPLLLQNFIDNFLEENWKWLISLISIPAILLTYKLVASNRKTRTDEALALSVTMQESSAN